MKTLLVVCVLAVWALTIHGSYGQYGALRPGTSEADRALREYERGSRPDPAKVASELAEHERDIESGRILFGADDWWGGWWVGKRFGSSNKDFEGTIAHKKPPDFKIGDWGCESYPFQAINKISNTECLVTIKYQNQEGKDRQSEVMLLRGLDMSKVTDGVVFVLQHPIEITGTTSYTTVTGSRKTVLVLECNSKRIKEIKAKLEADREAERKAAIERAAAEQEREAAIEAAKWRTWTVSKKTKVEAKFGWIINSTITLIKRDGSKLKVSLADLAAEDREWIANRLK